MSVIKINQMPRSKREIEAYVSNLKEMILSGNINGIEAAIFLKSMDEMIKQLKDDSDIKRMIISEVEKYGKSAEFDGTKITLSERKSYSFDSDSEWEQLEEEIIILKNRQKMREAFLKVITKPVADPETGEIINPMPCQSTTVTTVSLRK